MSLSPPDYTPVPFSAYLRFYAGGKLITLDGEGKPNYFQSFRFVRGAFSTGKFHLTITDPKWFEIHEYLQNHFDDISFYYGYEDGRQSRHYGGFITNITPSFLIDAVQLTIEGHASGPTAFSGTAKTRSWPDNRTHEGRHLRIDEIVTEIAQRNSWLIADGNGTTVFKCKEVKTYAAFDSTEPVNRHFHQKRQTDFEFIRMLAQYALSDKDGKGGFTTYIDFSGGGPTLHFHPLRMDLQPVKQFEYMRDPNSEVISFELEASTANSVMKQGGIETAVPWYNHTTKESGSVIWNNKNTPEKDKLNPKALIRTPLSQESIRPYVFLHPAENKEVAEALGKSHYMWLFNTGIRANMTIMGDPSLELNTVIYAVIRQPDGTPHYVTGNYLMVSLTDEITAGAYTTTINMIASGLGKGTEEVNGKQNPGYKAGGGKFGGGGASGSF